MYFCDDLNVTSMKLISRFKMMLAAVASMMLCLVGCGQKAGANTENDNAAEDSVQTVVDSVQTAEASLDEDDDFDLLASPWVFDGNRVIKEMKRTTMCTNNVDIQPSETIFQYDYDGRGRLMIINTINDNITESSEEYDFPTGTYVHEFVSREGGDSLWITNNSTFKSDAFWRITRMEGPNGEIENRVFDDKGQIIRIESEYDGNTYVSWTYTWNDKGMLMSKNDGRDNRCVGAFEYGDVANAHHQPFILPSFLDFERTSVVSYFPIARVTEDGRYDYQYEFNNDGTIRKVTEVYGSYKTSYEYTYGTL